MFEDIRRERSLILLLPLKDRGLLKQSRSLDHELNVLKCLVLQ